MIKYTLTAKAALMLAASALPLQVAFAQDNDSERSDGEENTIIVTGSIVQSLQSSVEEKRRAVNVTDIASSDDVGRFPDENIAAALTRLPGVATQLDLGQARYIQVRGAPNRWTSVSIDGILQTGTDISSPSARRR
jgi:outer membrane receptor for ferrienterochelin and colicin